MFRKLWNSLLGRQVFVKNVVKDSITLKDGEYRFVRGPMTPTEKTVAKIQNFQR